MGGNQAVKYGIEKHAAFYRGYLIDDRSLVPLTIAWATIVAIWLLVYLVSAIGPQATPQRRSRGASVQPRLPTRSP